MTPLPYGGPARVLVDTDVFTEVFIKHPTESLGTAWTQVLTGRTVVIAVQTEVELRAWPQLSGWNEKRAHALIERVEAVPRIRVADAVQREYVDLTAWAKHNGHAIHQKSTLPTDGLRQRHWRMASNWLPSTGSTTESPVCHSSSPHRELVGSNGQRPLVLIPSLRLLRYGFKYPATSCAV